MGSRATIVVYSERDPTAEVRRAVELIDRYESALSDYSDSSEAARLTRAPAGTWHDASPALLDALECAGLAHRASARRFDVTIGPVSAAWRVAASEGRQPTDAELRAARAAVGWHLLEIDSVRGRVRPLANGMRLDFGGIGKGLAADRALESLAEDGLPVALVSIGGDIAVGRSPPGSAGWRIDAASGDVTLPIEPVANRGVATSGDEFRFFVDRGTKRSHILDPASARPIETGPTLTVVAASAWRADALATIARLGGPDAAARASESLGGASIRYPGERSELDPPSSAER